jgi:transcription-repair coupling factor (superfamily II helicase)
LVKTLEGQQAFRQWVAQNEAGPDPEPQSILQAARPLVAAAIRRQRPGPLVILTARAEMVQQWLEQFELWLPPVEEGGPARYHFADPDALPFERIAWSGATRQRRLTALAALQGKAGAAPIVIAGARALMQKTLPARELRMALRTIKAGAPLRLEPAIASWVQTGYNPADVVEEPGTFARRGGIIDLWPPNLPFPVRIDLFGEDVESLRTFDPASQRTIRTIASMEVGPGSEALSKYGPAALERLGVVGGNLLGVETMAAAEASPLNDPALLLAVREEVRLEVDKLYASHSFHGIEWFLPYFYEQPHSLIDHMPADATLLVDDALDLFATIKELEMQAEGLRLELERSGELPRHFRPAFFAADELRAQLVARRPLLLGHGDLYGKSTSPNTALARSFLPAPRFGSKLKEIAADSAKRQVAGHAVVLATRQAARVQGALAEAKLDHRLLPELTDAPSPRSITLVQTVVGEGFVLRGERQGGYGELHFYTDTELFGWSKPQARNRSKAHSTVAAELFFADMKPGEYVVHLEHGIGQYDGLVRMELNGLEREYLQVSYARSDKLYVPVHQADRLSRFVGAGEKTPPVNRLGTADWAQVKERAKKAVADIADDLLKLYAERELVSGYSYSPDSPWQEEMEAAFPFQETDDQLRAVDAVKKDMESDRPMDRLICGDVGYGKTEVAIRAAFKAVGDGKQVAVLVPTTVLAQQHFRTFSNRLARFPVRVEVLSRFRTSAQQERTIAGLTSGAVDIVVGTHRLLSEDVTFKDLGLLVIDEEQRFGVEQKEKLKQLRTKVDVLTLSATPIPRTLHMSLSGIRDMSAINTPPKERQPIHTVLAEYDDVLLKQALQRELARQGQVYVVNNRIHGIHALADKIQHLAPEAVVAVGHGQMAERELEEVMMRFADGEIDVLVATTIIENGLDIPNANTMIINRADQFGLAQIYQLRGRVGRSTLRGHCYLLYDKGGVLSYDARRRLNAIIESSEELGAGFRIAMRDLEIRGAGDLLGARQHGQIDSVGFDLYTRLLAQSINEARRRKERFEEALRKQGRTLTGDAGAATPESAPLSANQAAAEEVMRESLDTPFDLADPLTPPVILDLPIDARIPASYVDDEALRLQLYRRIAGINHPELLEEMRQELVDRFGKDEETGSVPEEIEHLFYQIRVKILAVKAGVDRIGRELDNLALKADALENMDRKALQRRLQRQLGVMSEDNNLFVPESNARVGRRAIYLPLDAGGHWRTALLRVLEIMAVG